MTHPENAGNREAVIEVFRDGWTGGLQLLIGDEDGGYRLAGPKFNGSGECVLKARLTERDASQIRHYLDRAFGGPNDVT